MSRLAAPITIDRSAPIGALPRYLTLPEAAAYLRRSTRALARWEAKGLLRVIRPAGGNPLVDRNEVERLLAEGAS
jgi:excisionase family DNA binding protein